MGISGNGGVCNRDPTRTMKELSEFVSARRVQTDFKDL
jgi:hypothetical protein